MSKLRQMASLAVPGCDIDDLFKQFDAVASRYCLSDNVTRPLSWKLLEEALAMVVSQEHLRNADIEALNRAAQQLRIAWNATERMRIDSAILVRRTLIETWQPGSPPVVNCAGLMLQSGEVCRWEEPARLFDQRSRREYAGFSQGVSIPIGGGLRYRVGAFKGAPIDTTYLSDSGDGVLHVTSDRICFAGSQASASVPWKRIINITGFSDGLAVHTTSSKKPVILKVVQPELTVQIISLVNGVGRV